MTSPAHWYDPSPSQILATQAAMGQMGIVSPTSAIVKGPNQQTGDYTLKTSDSGITVEVTKATKATITVPASVFPAGSMVQVCQIGAGQVLLAGGPGMTLHAPGGYLATAQQYSMLTIRFRSLTQAIVYGDYGDVSGDP